jgi:hypothetical protein
LIFNKLIWFDKHYEKTSAPKETSKKPQRKPKEVILVALKEQPSISIRELAAQYRLSVHSVQHHINKLKEDGVIRHVGSTKAGRWEVVKDYFDTSGGDGIGCEDERLAQNHTGQIRQPTFGEKRTRPPVLCNRGPARGLVDAAK